MKIAYLVFTYKNPAVLQRTIKVLSGKDCAFFIHVDAKSDIAKFSAIRGSNVSFTEIRLPVHWAEFSGVRAILLLLRQALESSQGFEYFVLLSGSEYPLRGADYIHDFLARNNGTEFISMVSMPNEAAGKPLSRVNTLRLPSEQPVSRFLMKGLARVGLANRDHRKYLGDLVPYAGNTWWTLTRAASEFVVEFGKANPHVGDFFRNVFAPEETYFQTILGNSPFSPRIRRNLVFEDWSGQSAHPTMINRRHVSAFAACEQVYSRDPYGVGEVLFARKFSDDSLDLLDEIDDMVARKESSHRSLVDRSQTAEITSSTKNGSAAHATGMECA
jgi:hypothetical protein